MANSHCSGGQWGGCGRTFTSVSAFEKHRVGTFIRSTGQCTRRCMSDAELVEAGFVALTTKKGPVWSTGMSPYRLPPQGRQKMVHEAKLEYPRAS